MHNPEAFKSEFDTVAVDNCIRATAGKLAYGYYCKAVLEQSEIGRIGVHRQIMHLQETDARQGYRTPWELLYIDVHSGLDFGNRLALTKLCREITSLPRRADAVFIENLDRLSRNTDWHLRFLLDEFARTGIEVVFWKDVFSPSEWAVMDAIAQLQAFEQPRPKKLRKVKRLPQRKDSLPEQDGDAHGE